LGAGGFTQHEIFQSELAVAGGELAAAGAAAGLRIVPRPDLAFDQLI
jgi:hypothetical protein